MKPHTLTFHRSVIRLLKGFVDAYEKWVEAASAA